MYSVVLCKDNPTAFAREREPLVIGGMLRQMIVMDLYTCPFRTENARDIIAPQASIYEENERALARRRWPRSVWLRPSGRPTAL